MCYFLNKKTCQNDKVFIKLKIKEKIIAVTLLQKSGGEFPSLGGVAKIQRIFDGVVKFIRYKMTFFKFRRKNKNEYLCSPNIQKNVFKNNSTQSRK